MIWRGRGGGDTDSPSFQGEKVPGLCLLRGPSLGPGRGEWAASRASDVSALRPTWTGDLVSTVSPPPALLRLSSPQRPEDPEPKAGSPGTHDPALQPLMVEGHVLEEVLGEPRRSWSPEGDEEGRLDPSYPHLPASWGRE